MACTHGDEPSLWENHLLQLSSSSISIFKEWRLLEIPVKVILCLEEKQFYSLEYVWKELKMKRMAILVSDMETEHLLDYLDVCLDFIEESRKQGSILVHCLVVNRAGA